MEPNSHKCPRPKSGALPLKILEAAKKSKTDEVISWLKNGGDINSANMNEETLLHIACAKGDATLVRELLNHEGVHINHRSLLFSTPLATASSKGHVECVEALLSSTSECQADCDSRRHNKSAIMRGALNMHWGVVKAFLRAQKLQFPNDMEDIFNKSVNSDEWEIAREVVELLTSNNGKNISKSLCKIYEEDKWDYLSAIELFRLTEFHEEDAAKLVLCRMLAAKDWVRLGDTFRILYKEMEVDIDLAEAILQKNDEEVQKLLAGKQVDRATKNGALMVASLSGASEMLANLLFNLDYNYPDVVMKNALILTSLSNSLALLQVLLEEGKFSYKTLVRARSMTKAKDCRLLMKKGLQREVENIIPLTDDSEEEDSTDDDDDDSTDDENENVVPKEFKEFGFHGHTAPTGFGQDMDMELFEALLANMQQSLYDDGDDDDSDDSEDDDDDDEDEWVYGEHLGNGNVNIGASMQSKAGCSDDDSDSDDSDN